MKSRARRRIGTTVTLNGRVGTIVAVASQEREPIVEVRWAEGGSSWHRPDELDPLTSSEPTD